MGKGKGKVRECTASWHNCLYVQALSVCISIISQHFFPCASLLYSSTACAHFYYDPALFCVHYFGLVGVVRQFFGLIGQCSSPFVCAFLLCSSTFSMRISIVLQHFFVHAYLLCSTFLLYSNTFCMHFYCFLALAACISTALDCCWTALGCCWTALGCCWGPCPGMFLV